MAKTENIFRFISLRPTELENETGRLNMYVYKHGYKSPFYDSVNQAVANGASKQILTAIATKYQGTPSYVKEFQSIKFPIAAMLNWITDNGRLTFKNSNFLGSLETLAGKPLKDIVKGADFLAAYSDLCDSILADILSGTPVNQKEEKISAIKVLFTLKALGEKTLKLKDDELVDDFYGRSTVIIPFLKPAREQVPERPQPEPSPNDREKEKTKRREYLSTLETAHRELSNMATDDKYRFVPETSESEAAKIKELENELNLMAARCKGDKEDPKPSAIASSTNSVLHPARQEFLLSNKAMGLLSDTTRQILSDFHFEVDRISPVKAVARIENEIGYLNTKTESDASYNRMIALGGTYVNKHNLMTSLLGAAKTVLAGIGAFLTKCSVKAGIGDLLIVRQTLKAYELAEFAHVENALAGEFRERVHKRLDVTEVITDTITETETEKERDLQSTERSEMQTEAEKIVQQQAHVDAGLQVSGSYGPSVSFTASLNAGFSSSVQETQKKSTSYSREVTEKTAEKVRTKVTEEQRRRVLQQIEESNTHRIDNTAAGAKHMRGIYRWLNKIYDAQIYNYGQRMMYEFVIPEPAAFFLYATVENPPVDSDLVKPDIPTYPIWSNTPLKPSNLTRTNYNDYVSKYNVTNAPEPPSAFSVKTSFDKQDGKDPQNFGRASAIALPDGYEAYAAVVSSDYTYQIGQTPSFHCMLGSTNFDRTPFWGAEYKSFPRKYRGEVSVSMELRSIMAFAIGVDVFCSLTDEAFAKWQLKMYDAIMQAYLDQKSAYDSKMEQKDIQKGVQILGRNPIENRRIEKEELKKLIIMILTNTAYLDVNSYTSSAEPIMDLSKVCPNGSYIRFFENAFEWENILYVFYPYFWGRHVRWINALQFTDPDLDFAAFLKAGAARVQIPVRPGFEKAIAFYCQTLDLFGSGIIWDGNDVPVIGDDLYVPIIKEISENLGKLDDGVPYPDPNNPQPWEVTVPTSLVVLQDLNEVPNIRDIMTGNNINIVNP